MTEIGSNTFVRCSSLESITIPNGVTTIGSYAFDECSSLKSIVIPENVTEIQDNAFKDCGSLESIRVASNNPVYDSRNDCNAIIETKNNKLIRPRSQYIGQENMTYIPLEKR